MSIRLTIGDSKSSQVELNIQLDPYIVDALVLYAVMDMQRHPETGPTKEEIIRYVGFKKFSQRTPVRMTEDELSSSLERLVTKRKLEKYPVVDENEWRYRASKIS